MISIKSRHLSLIDEEMPTDEERLIPPKPVFTDYKMVFLKDL
jgi:hypothetical protein